MVEWVKVLKIISSVGIVLGGVYLLVITGTALSDYYLILALFILLATYFFGFYVGLAVYISGIGGYAFSLLYLQADLGYFLRLVLLVIVTLPYLLAIRRIERSHETIQSIVDIEKSKKDFIAIASHNLRTPVAAIYGYLELLFRDDTGKLNDDQRNYLEKIKKNNQELERTAEQLLEITVLEVGSDKEINLMKQASRIEPIVQEIVDHFIEIAQSKNIALVYFKPSDILPFIYIDVEKIKSVIRNLVDNAVKYTEKGSVVVRTKVDNTFVVIEVADTGIGIPAPELPKIFNKFYRTGNILIYNRPGIGLGLYLGKKIVELHGGHYTVESTEGKGSIFRLYLPIMDEDRINQ